jgi:NAD(P)-dependent dehydrogenase (short-subunit alcohol dehydrogenase family)
MQRLTGRRALVTGGTSGLGSAIVRRLVAEGAQVVFTGRDDQRGQDIQEETTAAFVRADSTSDGDSERAVAYAADRLGGLEILVLNAGTGLMAPLVDTPTKDFSRLLDVNVTGYFRYAKAATPILSQDDGGCMIHIASDAGITGETNYGAYSISKAAVIMLGQILAAEGGPLGVRSNIVCPGDIAPGMREMGKPGEPEREEKVDDWPIPPLGRVGQSEDVAAAVAYLASDDASFCNGSVLLVDGGMRSALLR